MLVAHIERVWQANMQVYGADKVWRQMNREAFLCAQYSRAADAPLGLQGARRDKTSCTTGPSSDRGSQYVSIRYTERLTEAGIEPSVGSPGDRYDNALAETIPASQLQFTVAAFPALTGIGPVALPE